ncbi:MAG TPA: nicotinate phosphoribosyltransferase [Acidimicrobiales bacterium]|nr:nicotinate phosphoribosyltransferase [Acidimicrobiales bacterium]
MRSRSPRAGRCTRAPGAAVHASACNHLAVVSTALLTDHYELTMLDAALASGAAERQAVFEVSARHLPAGRSYGVVGGVGRLLDAIERFRFGPPELDYLRSRQFLAPETLDWLGEYRFGGSITGYPEGEVFFPGSPVLTVEAPFGAAVILETLVLSILNFDSAVAAAGARMVTAALGRGLIEMGGRRVHEQAAVAAARMACLVGFSATSNLEAARRFGVPTSGTAAHAFTLAHDDEEAAFAAQLARLGIKTTLLVDTFDVQQGIHRAVAAARAFGAPGPGAVRIDSGDLAAEARNARALLDALGATSTGIVASGDLDEFSLAALADAPIDAYGVGTKLVTGSGAPTAEMIYKLVAVAAGSGTDAPMRPVEKRSLAKETIGGRKRAWRVLDSAGVARQELLVVGAADAELPLGAFPLQVSLVENGEIVHRPSLEQIGAHHQRAKRQLPPEAHDLRAATTALTPIVVHDG